MSIPHSSQRWTAENLPPELASRFVPLGPRAEDDAWAAAQRPHSALASAARGLLRRAMSDYDANGLLGMHPMRLLGTEQWRDLFAHAGLVPRETLLDIGAGDGGVTATLAPLVSRVVASETSGPMARRLRAHGYEVILGDLADDSVRVDTGIATVALLNVIDRSARPRSLVRRAATFGDQLLVSVPLPLRPHVDLGGRTVDPDEPLPPARATWEEGAGSLLDEWLPALGWRAQAFSRVPYRSRGSGSAAVVSLDALVALCTRDT